VGAPGAEARAAHDDPVASLEAFDAAAGGDDFGDTFIASYGCGFGGSEGGAEVWFGGVDALDLVNVCRVDGRGEEAEGDEVFVGGRDAVAVETEDVFGFAIVGEG
jgi:hypothetical protein